MSSSVFTVKGQHGISEVVKATLTTEKEAYLKKSVKLFCWILQEILDVLALHCQDCSRVSMETTYGLFI